MKCPVCESTGISRKYRLRDRFFGVTAEEFDGFHCTGCRALFLDPDLVRTRLAEFYPPNYWWSPGGWSGSLEAGYREWVLKHDHLAFVKKALRGYENPKCLEIGCGSGSFLGLARREGIDIRGLELSAEAVERARAQGIEGIDVGTLDDAVKSGERFDAVIMFHLLEHLVDPREYMKKLAGILREGGCVILQVPNLSSWQALGLGRRWYGLDCPRHVCNYSERSLGILLTSAGFRKDRVETFSLRDNAPALVSSLFPFLDPLGSRVKCLAAGRVPGELSTLLRNLSYFLLVLAAIPWAWFEALCSRGATIKISAVRISARGNS